MTIKSSRYLEYFWPFTLLFISFGFTDITKIMSWKKIKKEWWKKQNKYIKLYLLTISLVFCILVMPAAFKDVIKTKIPTKWPIDKFEQSSIWLQDNTNEKEIIFHNDWSIWPLLFYNNTYNNYLIGLDPTFFHNYDQELHQLYTKITKGEIKNNLHTIIKEKFNTSTIFIEKNKNKDFVKNLNKSFYIKKTYEDKYTNIYIIK